MGVRRRGILVALVLGALSIAGCGDDSGDSSNGNDSGGTSPVVETPVDSGCTESHPTRTPSDPPGFVIACLGDGGYSLHLKNTSDHVLRVWPNTPETTQLVLDPLTSPTAGVAAAGAISGSGWNGGTFVLPLGHGLTATSMDDPSVRFEADLALTGMALAARYYGQLAYRWLGGSARTNAQRVASCANSADTLVRNGDYVEDVLENSLDLLSCRTLLADLARETSGNPGVKLPRMRTQLFDIAEPALKTRLISQAAQILR